MYLSVMTAPRLTAALADRYRIERELGQGGMATVYLATDLKHARQVAIKVLQPELSAIVGAERFLAEIRTTASLQHPHILGLIDSGTADGLVYYVMPYVEGEALRGRLDREKQLPVEDALRLAREVASALEFAHRRGVVHRDIKPENILLQDGQALVADFGIALALEQAGGTRMTQTGMSLGTPAYMSPEQATGDRDIGPRSDVYSLGAMTYEMLSGQPPFTGPNSRAIVAKVLTEGAPPLRAQRPTIPPAAEHAILKALQKLPADRFGSAKVFADALTAGGTEASQATLAIPAIPASTRVRSRLLVAFGLAVAAGLGAVAGQVRRPPGTVAHASRLAVLNPELGGSGSSSANRQVAFVPGTNELVYLVVGPEGSARLVRQPLWAEVATPITGTERMGTPVISPDGSTLVGTSATGQVLQLPLDGGKARPIAPNVVLHTADAAYSPSGSLWFSAGEAVLPQVGRVEGDSFVVTVRGVNSGKLQQMLDDETALLVQNRLGNATGPLTLVDVGTGRETTLLNTNVIAGMISSGYLLYVTANGTLQAVPYSSRARTVAGPAVTLATNVAVTGEGVAQFALGSNGTLAYIPEEPFALEFVARDGSARPVLAERRNFHAPLFSPDGKRLSMDFNTDAGRNVWIMDLEAGTLNRASFEVDGHDATWSPDGRHITFSAPQFRDGQLWLALLRKLPGSAEPAETLLATPSLAYTGTWLHDGSALVTTALNVRHDPTSPLPAGQPDTRADAAINRNGGRGPLEPLVASAFGEQYATVSPDDHWLAFVSDQSGRNEVYVRDLAGTTDQVLVSTSGGSEPVWSRDGRELFYRETGTDDARLVAARVTTAPLFKVTDRTRLFPLEGIVSTNPHANYDVSPDGKYFVVVRRSPSARIIVIQDFPDLIRRMQAGTEPE